MGDGDANGDGDEDEKEMGRASECINEADTTQQRSNAKPQHYVPAPCTEGRKNHHHEQRGTCGCAAGDHQGRDQGRGREASVHGRAPQGEH